MFMRILYLLYMLYYQHGDFGGIFHLQKDRHNEWNKSQIADCISVCTHSNSALKSPRKQLTFTVNNASLKLKGKIWIFFIHSSQVFVKWGETTTIRHSWVSLPGYNEKLDIHTQLAYSGGFPSATKQRNHLRHCLYSSWGVWVLSRLEPLTLPWKNEGSQAL